MRRIERRGRRLAWLAAALLAAGCGGGEGDGPPPAEVPDSVLAGADTRAAAPPYRGGGLPDTSGFPAPADAPPAAAPADTAPAPPSAPPAAPQPRLGRDWTAGVVETRRPGSPMTTLLEVRAARNEGFDRIVFQFAGGALPGYHVEYVDRPVRECGSGEAVQVAGDGWLRVRLEPAQAHTEQGEPTVRERRRRFQLPVVRELRAVCDFEGQVEWVVGVASPNRFRVLELREPARLVVDVMH